MTDITSTSRRRVLQLAAGVSVAAAMSGTMGATAFAADEHQAKVTQVRNATLLIEYAGTRFLLDPMLGDVGGFPPFPKTPNQVSNPTAPLPVDIAELTKVDAVIVTHMHEDHWDKAAQDALDKALPIFVQDEADKKVVEGQGFKDVRVLTPETMFNGINLSRTKGLHGSKETIAKLGENFGRVCGVAFKHPDHKSIYCVGDSVWNDHVADAISTHKPDVIIMPTGHAYVFGVGYLIPGAEDTLIVHKAAPDAIIIANHMEAVNHCVDSRAQVLAFADANGFLDKVRAPADGETMTF